MMRTASTATCHLIFTSNHLVFMPFANYVNVLDVFYFH